MLATLSLLAAAAAPVVAAPPTFEQQSFRDITYYSGPDADSVRHKLDVHVPRGHKDFPVIVFIHGGAWIKGNKDQFGLQTMLARTFNRHGIGVVCPNYRLSPDVQHPEHARDVARAFAWTYKNINKFGGRADQLFISGHSAGGHLSALLATDPSYLKAEGLALTAIRGAMPMSGVYAIPSSERVFDVAFGKDPSQRAKASPISHVTAGLPPFLVMLADKELPNCDRPGAQAFCQALQKVQCRADFCEIPSRNHVSIFISATRDTDPVMQSMLSFVITQVTLDGLGERGATVVDDYATFLARYIAHVAKE